jgi:hypothetical protein
LDRGDTVACENGHGWQITPAFPSLRVEIPLPLRDESGERFPQEDVRWFEDQLIGFGSGFTKFRRVRGHWRSPTKRYREAVTWYLVGIDARHREDLPAFLQQAARRFGQQQVFCLVSPAEILSISSSVPLPVGVGNVVVVGIRS